MSSFDHAMRDGAMRLERVMNHDLPTEEQLRLIAGGLADIVVMADFVHRDLTGDRTRHAVSDASRVLMTIMNRRASTGRELKLLARALANLLVMVGSTAQSLERQQ